MFFSSSFLQKILVNFFLISLNRISCEFQTKDYYEFWPVELFNSNIDFYQARKKCQNLQGQLAILKNQNLKPEIEKQINKLEPNINVFFVGLIREERNETRWIDGSRDFQNTFSFANRAQWKFKEMCGLLKRDNSGLFLDFASCERTDLGYMCQFPPNKGKIGFRRLLSKSETSAGNAIIGADNVTANGTSKQPTTTKRDKDSETSRAYFIITAGAAVAAAIVLTFGYKVCQIITTSFEKKPKLGKTESKEETQIEIEETKKFRDPLVTVLRRASLVAKKEILKESSVASEYYYLNEDKKKTVEKKHLNDITEENTTYSSKLLDDKADDTKADDQVYEDDDDL